MDYIKVEFEQAGIAYQEIDRGQVLRYVDEQGTELFVDPPIGDGCRVLDADVVPTVEMVAAAEARAPLDVVQTSPVSAASILANMPAYDVQASGERRTGPADRRSGGIDIGPGPVELVK